MKIRNNDDSLAMVNINPDRNDPALNFLLKCV